MCVLQHLVAAELNSMSQSIDDVPINLRTDVKTSYIHRIYNNHNKNKQIVDYQLWKTES